MGRKRIYATATERQKAHRERMAVAAPHPKPVVAVTRQRQLSRPLKLAAATAILRTLQQEYEQWRDRLPDFQEGSEQETRLTETIELLDQILEQLADVQPPKGFGRD